MSGVRGGYTSKDIFNSYPHNRRVAETTEVGPLVLVLATSYWIGMHRHRILVEAEVVLSPGLNYVKSGHLSEKRGLAGRIGETVAQVHFGSLLHKIKPERKEVILGPIVVGLSWYLLQTTPRDSINIIVVGLLLALILGATPALRLPILSPAMFAGIFLLVMGPLIGTLFAGGGPQSLRAILLIVLVVGLGVAFAACYSPVQVQGGLLTGSLMVAGYGWAKHFMYVSDSDVLGGSLLEIGFFGEYMGVTSMESYELLSALVGTLSAISLMITRPSRIWRLLPPIIILIFTVVRLDMTVGLFLVLLSMFGALGFVALDGRWAGRARPVGRGIIIFSLLSLPLLALSGPNFRTIASIVGETESISVRAIIWTSALQPSTAINTLVGNGSYFWDPASTSFKETNARISSALVDTEYSALAGEEYLHAHSMYIDYYLAFGILGCVVGLSIFLYFLAQLHRRWILRQPWIEVGGPFLLLTVILFLGFTESVVIMRPNGWFVVGILLGTVVFSRPPISNRGPGQ